MSLWYDEHVEILNAKKRVIERHVDKKLRVRLFIYICLSIAILFLVTYRVVRDEIQYIYPATAMIIGLVMGVAITRILKIKWDRKTKKVIGHLDEWGIGILVVYIMFEIYRDKVVALFIHGPEVVTTSFALLAGIMIGRVVGIRGKIQYELDQNI